MPELPTDLAPETTAAYVRAVLSGKQLIPAPIALQVEHILRLVRTLNSRETRQ